MVDICDLLKNWHLFISDKYARYLSSPSMRNSTELDMTHSITNTERFPRWRHQMEIFSALLAICAWNSPVTGEFPAQRPVTQSFDVFFDLRLDKRL